MRLAQHPSIFRRVVNQTSLRCGVACVALAATMSSAVANDLMAPSQAARLGLTEAWRRQMQVSAGAQSIADQQIYVVEGAKVEFVEVIDAASQPLAAPESDASAESSSVSVDSADKLPGAVGISPPGAKVYARFRVDKFASKGAALEKAEAERQARQQVRVLTRRGIKSHITMRTAPIVRLYTLGDDGTLQCQDAETGELVWLARFGHRDHGYGKLGIGDDLITVINGSNLIRVDAMNGEEIVTESMKSVPLFGAIHCGDYSLIPLIRGGVECYPLKDATIDPFMELVAGAALAMPTKAPGSNHVAWGTDRGFVYFMELSGKPSVQFRLNTDGIVNGKIASAAGERFFFGSEAGQVYCVHATRTGVVVWNKPFGEPFYGEPLVYNDTVFLRSTYGSLYALNADTGDNVWTEEAKGVDELIACFNDRLYVRMLSGILAEIDVKTGKRTQAISSIQTRNLLKNYFTDRLYLLGESGVVQCLKPIGSDLPTISKAMLVSQSPVTEESADTKKLENMDAGTKAADPFGAGGADPFGAGAGADPFGAGAGAGAGADPFGGGGGDDAMKDPFGSDPFGN